MLRGTASKASEIFRLDLGEDSAKGRASEAAEFWAPGEFSAGGCWAGESAEKAGELARRGERGVLLECKGADRIGVVFTE